MANSQILFVLADVFVREDLTSNYRNGDWRDIDFSNEFPVRHVCKVMCSLNSWSTVPNMNSNEYMILGLLFRSHYGEPSIPTVPFVRLQHTKGSTTSKSFRKKWIIFEMETQLRKLNLAIPPRQWFCKQNTECGIASSFYFLFLARYKTRCSFYVSPAIKAWLHQVACSKKKRMTWKLCGSHGTTYGTASLQWASSPDD